MTQDAPPGQGQGQAAELWRGVDLSGTTWVLGVGTGRLIELLAQGADSARGQLIVMGRRGAQLQALTPLRAHRSLALVEGRSHQIPALDETVDLLVVSGILREAPASQYEGFGEEIWRVLVPGGQLRVSDVIEPSEAEHDQAWALRNALVRKLGEALGRPTALSVDLRRLALALRTVGFEGLSLSLLPGYVLTDAWLEETANAIRTMAGQIAQRTLRDEILEIDLPRVSAAYQAGGQRAAQRFVLQGRKPGDLSLDMLASFTEEDLQDVD